MTPDQIDREADENRDDDDGDEPLWAILLALAGLAFVTAVVASRIF